MDTIPNPKIPIKAKPKVRLKFAVSKKERFAKEFYSIIDVNFSLVDLLISQIRMFSGDSKIEDLSGLIETTRIVLDNNKRLQKLVNEVLAELN